MLLQENLALTVPKHEKDEAKMLGVRPCYVDEKFSHWYIPAQKNVMPFQKWWPEEFRKKMIENGTIQEAPVEIMSASSQTLNSVLKKVRDVVGENFKKPIWIKAEIVNISQRNGHTYLEMSDYDLKGSENAKAKAMIWASDSHILRNFKERTQLELKSGMKIMFQAMIDFSEKFGLGLTLVNIDPSFTVGEMELRVAAIRKKLVDQNIFDLNKNLPRPFDFFRVIVISPADAAGLGDFKTQADALVSHGLCKFKYISATFSGNDCTKSVVTALNSASEWASSIDAVVIIRGGGDKAGLYALNEYAIIEAVCKMQCPVIVGIGHDRDNTLLDEVANVRCATPSLVISYITNTMVQNAHDSRNNYQLVNKFATASITKAKAQTNQLLLDIKALALVATSKARNQSELAFSDINAQSKNILALARQNVKSIMKEVYLNNPINVLERGYAIIREQGGNVLTTKESAHGKNIQIMFKDGTSSATITD